MFRVGQKVVCIDAKRTNSRNYPELVEGNVYTVAWVGVYYQALCVRLCEVRRAANNKPFYAKRFRPAVDRPTDISVFTNLIRSRELVS